MVTEGLSPKKVCSFIKKQIWEGTIRTGVHRDLHAFYASMDTILLLLLLRSYGSS
jgi:hypothetical protein